MFKLIFVYNAISVIIATNPIVEHRMINTTYGLAVAVEADIINP